MYFDYFTNGDLWHYMTIKKGVGFEELLLPVLFWWLNAVVILSRCTEIPTLGVVTLTTNPVSIFLYLVITVMPIVVLITALIFLVPLGLCVFTRKLFKGD